MLTPVGRAQYSKLHFPGPTGINDRFYFHGLALDLGNESLLVGHEVHPTDLDWIEAQGFQTSRWLDLQWAEKITESFFGGVFG